MINFAGSVQSYVKSLDMQWKAKKNWDEKSGKKVSPFATGSSFGAGLKVSVTNSTEMSGINTKEVDYRLSQIVLKLKRGKKLSGSEMEYLRQKDSGLYQKALKIEQEREEYERELKKCKTKEDVRRVNAIKSQLIMHDAKKAEAANDIDAATEVEMRFAAIKDAHETFVNSRAFERLPEDYEELNKSMGSGRSRSKSKGPKTSAPDDAKTEEALSDENNGADTIKQDINESLNDEEGEASPALDVIKPNDTDAIFEAKLFDEEQAKKAPDKRRRGR